MRTHVHAGRPNGLASARLDYERLVEHAVGSEPNGGSNALLDSR